MVTNKFNDSFFISAERDDRKGIMWHRTSNNNTVGKMIWFVGFSNYYYYLHLELKMIIYGEYIFMVANSGNI